VKPAKKYIEVQIADELCKCYDIALIWDEIQTLGGWLDGHLFAAELFAVSPNLICLGKAFGAGLPIAAVLMEDRYKDVLAYNEAEFTYGGQVIACAAALTSLEILQREKFEVSQKGQLLGQRLSEIAQRFPSIVADIRRVGLCAGVEFFAESVCRRVYMECTERR